MEDNSDDYVICGKPNIKLTPEQIEAVKKMFRDLFGDEK